MQLIFFDGEEALREWRGNDNTYGARDLAQKWQAKQYSKDGYDGNHLDRIDVFVLLDLIGASDLQFVALKKSTQVINCIHCYNCKCIFYVLAMV